MTFKNRAQASRKATILIIIGIVLILNTRKFLGYPFGNTDIALIVTDLILLVVIIVVFAIGYRDFL